MTATEKYLRFTGRQQLSRHLKKGVVPSIFPWTKKPVPTADASEEQKATCNIPSIFFIFLNREIDTCLSALSWCMEDGKIHII